MAPPDFWWVAPAVVGTGILASLGAAFYTIFTNRRLARIKATLDLIEAAESKEYYAALYRHYRRFRKDAEFREAVLAPRTEEDRAALSRCWEFLNHYELVAIGFKEGILDERFYKRWLGYAVLRDYRDAREIIATARAPAAPGEQGDVEAFIELEELCVKWGAEPIMPARNYGQRPASNGAHR